MNTITIKPLSSEINKDYLDFFDTCAFTDGNPNGPCYLHPQIRMKKPLKRWLKNSKFLVLRKRSISMQ